MQLQESPFRFTDCPGPQLDWPKSCHPFMDLPVRKLLVLYPFVIANIPIFPFHQPIRYAILLPEVAGSSQFQLRSGPGQANRQRNKGIPGY